MPHGASVKGSWETPSEKESLSCQFTCIAHIAITPRLCRCNGVAGRGFAVSVAVPM